MNIHTSQDCNYYYYQQLTVQISKISWIEDYIFIQYCHNYDNIIVQLWESKNGAAFVHVDTDNSGNYNFKYKTWQNANMIFKIRAVINGVTQEFSETVNIKTPLVFKYDNSVNNVLVFDYLWLDANKSVYVNWGDSTPPVKVTGATIPYKTLSHNYETLGQFIITLTGDTDNIRYFFFSLIPNITQYVYGNMSKYALPSSLEVVELSSSKIGSVSNTNIENWFPLPANIGVLNIGGCGCLGNINGVVWSNSMWEIYLLGNTLTGNPFINPLPNSMLISHLQVRVSGCGFEGDLSAMQIPPKIWMLDLSSQTSVNKFFGDLSGVNLPTGDDVIHTPTVQGIYISMFKCKFTKGYRGHFKWVYVYSFRENLFDAAEIEDQLHYIDNYFVGGVVPLVSCSYEFHGAGMAVANAAALAHKLSIENKYIAAGFVATINVN